MSKTNKRSLSLDKRKLSTKTVLSPKWNHFDTLRCSHGGKWTEDILPLDREPVWPRKWLNWHWTVSALGFLSKRSDTCCSSKTTVLFILLFFYIWNCLFHVYPILPTSFWMWYLGLFRFIMELYCKFIYRATPRLNKGKLDHPRILILELDAEIE